MNSNILSIKNIIIVFLLLIGIFLGVYLVQRLQIFKSKASNYAAQAISITVENDQGRIELAPVEESGVPVFNIEGGSDVKIKLKDGPNMLDMFKN